MFTHWCEITSCNGVIDLHNARKNKFGFIFWIIVMVTMSVAGGFFTFRAIKSYIDTPFNTFVTTVPVSMMDLPELILCYRGGYNISTVKEANLSVNFIHAFTQAVPRLVQVLNISVADAEQELLNYMSKANISNRFIYQKFEYNCEDFLEGFFISRNSANDTCKNSERILGLIGGTCFTIKQNGVQWYPSIIDGLRMKLKAPNNSYAFVYPKEAYINQVNKEFTVTIEKTVGHQHSYRSVTIPINMLVQVMLTPKLYRRFSQGNQCEEDEIVYPTSNACFYHCWYRGYKDVCNCTMIDYANDDTPDYDICKPFETCWPESLADIHACNDKCKRKCTEWIYDSTLSYSPLDESLSKRGLSEVSLYYNAMQYTQIEEVAAFSYDTAIANVGGQFGLWLGISIVTIIQAIYYVCLSICNHSKMSKDVTPLKR